MNVVVLKSLYISSYFRIKSFALASSDNPPPLSAAFPVMFILAPVYWSHAMDEAALIDELMAWSPPPLCDAVLFQSTRILFCWQFSSLVER